MLFHSFHAPNHVQIHTHQHHIMCVSAFLLAQSKILPNFEGFLQSSNQWIGFRENLHGFTMVLPILYHQKWGLFPAFPPSKTPIRGECPNWRCAARRLVPRHGSPPHFFPPPRPCRRPPEKKQKAKLVATKRKSDSEKIH